MNVAEKLITLDHHKIHITVLVGGRKHALTNTYKLEQIHEKTMGVRRMSAWKLHVSMAGTLALMIGISTLFFAVILSLTGYFDFVTLGVLVGVFNIVQARAPYPIHLPS